MMNKQDLKQWYDIRNNDAKDYSRVLSETQEKLQALELKLSNYENYKENLDIKNKAIKSFLKSLPKSFLINCLVEMKIIKENYVTKEVSVKDE